MRFSEASCPAPSIPRRLGRFPVEATACRRRGRDMRPLLVLILLMTGCAAQRRVACPMVAQLLADGRPFCTAFAVSPVRGRHFYTAAHCIESAADRSLTIHTGSRRSDVVHVRFSAGRDIAYITVAEPLVLQARAVASGTKDGLLLLCGAGAGSIHRLAALGKREETVLVAGRACPGDSGSPVVDSAGRVLGLISRADLVGADGCAERYLEVVLLE